MGYQTLEWKKIDIEEMDHCYAVSVLNLTDGPHVLYATEGHGPCYMYSCGTGEKTVVWQEPGGTMGIVQIPGKDEFLAVQRFFPTFQSEDACIVWGKYADGNWEIKKILDLPYLHRFDIVTGPTDAWLIGCTLCTSKKEKDDWSDPGKIYAAKLPEDLNQPMELKVILDGLTKNHGYWRGRGEDGDCSYICCEEGVFRITPPETEAGEWKKEKLLDTPASDIAVWDTDGDGQEELAVIEPFHGGHLVIYHLDGQGYRETYRYPQVFEFGHVVWAGQFCSGPAVIAGYRKLDQKLFLLRYRDGTYQEQVIDRHTGPSNIAVWHQGGRDVIYAANRQAGKASAYLFENGE